MSLYSFFNNDKGKPGSDKLPKNRFLSYFDILKNRTGIWVGLSLLIFLFFLPLLAFLLIFGLYISQGDASITDEYLLAYRTFSLITIEWLISFPLLLLGFFGLGGAYEVVKKLAYQEGGIFLVKDFFKGTVSNWKSSLLAGVILYIGIMVVVLNCYYWPSVEEFPQFAYISLVVVSCLLALWLAMASMYLLTSGTIYKFSFLPSLKNNFLLATILYPKNLVFLLIGFIFLLVYVLFPYVFIQIVVLILLALYGFTHLVVVTSLYCLSVYDKFINSRYSQETMYAGLEQGKKKKEE